MSDQAHRDTVFGAMLMAVGGLIAGLCGLCSMAAFVEMIWSMVGPIMSGHGDGAVVGLLWAIVLVGVVGGVPTLIGIVLFRSGLRMRLDARARFAVAVFGDKPNDPA